jgi:hypothetical protein
MPSEREEREELHRLVRTVILLASDYGSPGLDEQGVRIKLGFIIVRLADLFEFVGDHAIEAKQQLAKLDRDIAELKLRSTQSHRR